MAGWRLAKSLEHLRSQVDAKWPDRGKESDGAIGDSNHQSRASDHNPWIKDGAEWVVSAIDITHDPKDGFDSYAFADMLLRNRDPRIKYVISNRRIGAGSQGPMAWQWRKYSGTNPHDHHVHISVKSDKQFYDDAKDWNIDGVPPPTKEVIADYVKPFPVVRKGSNGEYVKLLQSKIGTAIDGDFGPATEVALKAFQLANHLTVDGVCGPQTWKALG